MYHAGPVARTGPAAATRERPRADPDFGGLNRHEEAAADFLKWDTAQPGAKLAAMSNKSKSQPQQHQQQPQQHQQQPPPQQHHPPHVIKPVDQLPPRYQPPPQPTGGILKNHLHFASTATSASSSGQTGNSQGPIATLNHHQPRTLPPPPPSSQHLQQQQQQQSQQSTQQQQSQQPPKDAQSKYSPRIEHHHQHHHHPQPANTLIAAASAAASKNQQQQQPSTYLQQPKLGQSPYLPPSSQYPAVNSGQNALLRQRISDDEFLRLGPVEMLKFVRKTESDIARLAAEQHRQIQGLVSSRWVFSVT